MPSRIAAAVADRVRRQVPQADLRERDPDYLRDNLPWLWLLASFYFRAEVRGLERIPAWGWVRNGYPVVCPAAHHAAGDIFTDGESRATARFTRVAPGYRAEAEAALYEWRRFYRPRLWLKRGRSTREVPT